MSKWSDHMDLVPMMRQMQALEAAGVPVDPSKWTDDDFDRAAEVLNRLYEEQKT